jgi:signal transduction histidine kinase/ActR/RegA family two-component response regulator
VQTRLDRPEPVEPETKELARRVRRQFTIGLAATRLISMGMLVFILVQMGDINASITASREKADAAFLMTGTHTAISSFVLDTDQGIRSGAVADDTLELLAECRFALLADAEASDLVIDDPAAENALRTMVSLNLEVFDVLEEAVLAAQDGRSIAARERSSEAIALLEGATQATNELAGVRIDAAIGEADQATSVYAQTRTTIIAVGIVAILLTTVIQMSMTRSVSRRIAAIEGLHADAARHAQQTIEAQNHFLATMSHEVRTPLNGLLGLLDSIDADDLPEHSRHTLRLARQSGRDLLVVANDMLDVVSLDTAALSIAEVPTRPREVIRGIIDVLAPLAGERRTDVVSTVHRGVPDLIVTDQTRLRQILSNLVSNAIKHAEGSSVSIALAPSTLDGAAPADGDSATHLRFTVSDDGPGIIDELHGRIFDRFTTASSFPAATRGTGLGLAVSRELVELMGGRIGVRSAAGSGSSFWFTIPLRSLDVDPCTDAGADTGTAPTSIPTSAGSAGTSHSALIASFDTDARLAAPATRSTGAAAAATHISPAEGTAAHHGSRRVLVAEDDAVNRLVISTMLDRLGHRVTIVEDGERAVEAVSAEHFDVVLMDIQMPVMNGKEATLAIRSLPGDVAHLPIVAVTADVMPHQIAEFAALGIDRHLGKPFSLDQLADAIDRAVRLEARSTA